MEHGRGGLMATQRGWACRGMRSEVIFEWLLELLDDFFPL